MKNNSISTDAQMRSVCLRPEVRGNLFLCLLLGVHLLIAIPKSANCAYAQSYEAKPVAIQGDDFC